MFQLSLIINKTVIECYPGCSWEKLPANPVPRLTPSQDASHTDG